MDNAAKLQQDYDMILMEEMKKKYKSKKKLSKLYDDLKNDQWTGYMSVKRTKFKENKEIQDQLNKLMKTP